MLVVDTTVIVDFLVGEPEFQARATQMLRSDPHWIAPSLWRFELANVLCTMVRKGDLAVSAADEFLRTAENGVIETIDLVDSSGILACANEFGLTAYDASFVWLAMSRNLPLITRDSKVLRQCPDVAKVMP